MKKFILPLAAAVSLVACSQSPEDKVVEFTKNSMKDPKSFELVKAEPRDTIFKSTQIMIDRQVLVDEYTVEDAKFKQAMELADIYTGSYSSHGKRKWDNYMKIGQESLDVMKVLAGPIDSLLEVSKNLAGTPQDSVVSVVWYVSAYANNSKGERNLGEFMVLVPANGGKYTLESESSLKIKQAEQNLRVANASLSVF